MREDLGLIMADFYKLENPRPVLSTTGMSKALLLEVRTGHTVNKEIRSMSESFNDSRIYKLFGLMCTS